MHHVFWREDSDGFVGLCKELDFWKEMDSDSCRNVQKQQPFGFAFETKYGYGYCQDWMVTYGDWNGQIHEALGNVNQDKSLWESIAGPPSARVSSDQRWGDEAGGVEAPSECHRMP